MRWASFFLLFFLFSDARAALFEDKKGECSKWTGSKVLAKRACTKSEICDGANGHEHICTLRFIYDSDGFAELYEVPYFDTEPMLLDGKTYFRDERFCIVDQGSGSDICFREIAETKQMPKPKDVCIIYGGTTYQQEAETWFKMIAASDSNSRGQREFLCPDFKRTLDFPRSCLTRKAWVELRSSYTRFGCKSISG